MKGLPVRKGKDCKRVLAEEYKKKDEKQSKGGRKNRVNEMEREVQQNTHTYTLLENLEGR